MRPSATAAAAPRVLIVDDEEATRLLIARILTLELGAEVALAGTSEEALRQAAVARHDAIVLDLMMPGIGGHAVLRRIREAGPNRRTPVIICSVLSDEATMRRCREDGADAHLVKPVERRSLTATLRAQLRRAAAH